MTYEICERQKARPIDFKCYKEYALQINVSTQQNFPGLPKDNGSFILNMHVLMLS